jgi:hypothetical protein
MAKCFNKNMADKGIDSLPVAAESDKPAYPPAYVYIDRSAAKDAVPVGRAGAASR